MPVLMKLAGLANGQPSPLDGQYLKSFDFEAGNGCGEGEFTPVKALAMRFADLQEAMAYLKTTPACQPTRSDGRPNRPLTATTWEIVSL